MRAQQARASAVGHNASLDFTARQGLQVSLIAVSAMKVHIPALPALQPANCAFLDPFRAQQDCQDAVNAAQDRTQTLQGLQSALCALQGHTRIYLAPLFRMPASPALLGHTLALKVLALAAVLHVNLESTE